MQDINIEEKKTHHTRTFIAVGVIVLLVILFTLYYQLLSSKQGSQEDLVSSQTSKDFTAFLAKQVNEEQKTDESLPVELRSLLGVWQGEWHLTSQETVPAALVVSDVVVGKGITLSYKNSENKAHAMIPVEGTIVGTTVLLPQEPNIVALEAVFPQFSNAEPVQFHFWLPEGSATMKGEFTDPQTRKTVRGEFVRVR